jgi:colanic acid/amylovoran biosynthesis glycosyltransferase
MRLAYCVSRFPSATETFIFRELNAVREHEGIGVELLVLFPPKQPFAHPGAERWAQRARRPGPFESVIALGWWARRHPLRLLHAVAVLVSACAGHTGVLGRSLATLPIAAAHARTMRTLEIDHVHAHFATYPTLTAWLCSRLVGVPYSFTVHAHDLFVDQDLLAIGIREARFVVAISEFNRRFLRDHGWGRATPVYVIHCGVEPDSFRFRPRQVPRTGSVRALCVASLEEHKGHAVLLDAIATGGEALARLQLDLVGGGPERQQLEAQIARLGLAQRVHFHGPLGETDVQALLDRADLFVLPSRVARNGQMEGLPNALLEAVACGLPVIASRLSGIPELIRNSEIGLLAEPGDVASLRTVLERALEQGFGIRTDMGRQIVEREFDICKSADQLVALFQGRAMTAGVGG